MNLAGYVIVETTLVQVAQSVEALAADYFLLEPFRKTGSLFGSDQDEDAVQTVKRIQALFE